MTLTGLAGKCPDCGKWRYETRKWARAAMKRYHPDDSTMHAYRCGRYWHYGHNRRKFDPVEVEPLTEKARKQMGDMAKMRRPK